MNPALNPYILQHASCRASLLLAAGLSPNDLLDMRQELVLDCWRGSPSFNPARGDWRSFVRGVMRNHSIVLFAKLRKRERSEVLADDLRREQQQCAEEDDVLDSLQPRDLTQSLQLSIDVRVVLNSLSPQLRGLALLLMEAPIREIPKTIGKSRSRCYQMRRELQTAFRQAGFGPTASEEAA